MTETLLLQKVSSRVDAEELDRLRADARRHGHTVSEEIREQLAQRRALLAKGRADRAATREFMRHVTGSSHERNVYGFCIYCGAACYGLACRDHRDLLILDPNVHEMRSANARP